MYLELCGPVHFPSLESLAQREAGWQKNDYESL